MSRPVSRTPRVGRSERGSAVTDFVMILFILLPMFAALFQLSLVLHVRNTLSSAAAEGARRAAVVGATPEDGTTKAAEQIIGTLNEDYTRRMEIQEIMLGGVPAYEIVITAEVPALGLGGPAFQIRASGSAIIETAP